MRGLSASCYASSLLLLDSFVSKRFLFVFFGMLVTVTVSRGEQESQRLEAASRAVEQAAGGAKIDLRPCYGAQDTGFAASLPLGLNVRSYTPAGPLGRLLS